VSATANRETLGWWQHWMQAAASTALPPPIRFQLLERVLKLGKMVENTKN